MERAHWRWAAVIIALVSLLMAAIAVVGIRALGAQQTGIEILGRQHLGAVGDTATWCAVVSYDDGTYRLGDRALRVVATGPDSVVATIVRERLVERCAPLVRAAGIVVRRGTVPMTWSSVPARQPGRPPSAARV